MLRPGFNVVIGGQAGSEGKGKVSCYYAHNFLTRGGNGKLVVACNHMPNAGHTFVDGQYKYVARNLPTPAFFNNSNIYPDFKPIPVIIGPGAAVDVDVLMEEIEQCQLVPGETLFINPRAGVVTKEHKQLESGCLDNVSSTKKGGGACLAAKVMRQPDKDGKHAIMRDMIPNKLKKSLCDTSEFLTNAISSGATVLFEGAQGFDLDINHGLEYPYTTSRMTNVASALAESGVSPRKLAEVIMVVRPYPIRVGNSYDVNGAMLGTSGPYSDDNVEVDYEYVRKISGCEHDITERTTVTGKIRRIFTFSKKRFKRAMEINDPSRIVITFADHIDSSLYKATGSVEGATESQRKNIVDFLEENIWPFMPINTMLDSFSTGPDNADMLLF